MRLYRGTLMLVIAAGCGGDGDSGGGPAGPTGPGNNPSTPAPSSAEVQMRSQSDGYDYETHSFSPTSTSIAVGGTVTWVNNSGVLHNVTFGTTGAPANVANFSAGTQTRTFSNRGTFAYSCSNHAGMSGTVTVP